MPHKNIVYILGAGASVSSGVPVMANFVDVMYDIFRHDSGQDAKQFSQVFSSLSLLRKVYSNSFIDLNNLESVFATFDMALFTNTLGEYSSQQIQEIYDTLARMIVMTVERRTQFTYAPGNGVPLVDGNYPLFVTMALERAERSGARCDFISLNYDIALDCALSGSDYFLSRQIVLPDYGFSVASSHPLLLKLHGSVNWAYRNNVLTPLSYIPSDIYRDGQQSTLSYARIVTGEEYVKGISFSTRTDVDRIMIVPPSYSKHFDDSRFRMVWQNAANVLSEADAIVFIGYSVPETDLMFRYLFSIGTLNNDRIRSIIILNPQDQIELTYRKFLGQFTSKRLFVINKEFSAEALRDLSLCLR